MCRSVGSCDPDRQRGFRLGLALAAGGVGSAILWPGATWAGLLDHGVIAAPFRVVGALIRSLIVLGVLAGPPVGAAVLGRWLGGWRCRKNARTAPLPLMASLVADADMIFTMEAHHRERIRKTCRHGRPPDARIVSLKIPDDYPRGDPDLVALLHARVTPRLTALRAAG